VEVGGRAGACMRECVLACSGQGRGHGEGWRKCGPDGAAVHVGRAGEVVGGTGRPCGE